MTGKRVDYDNDGPLPDAGSYWNQDGGWYAMTPNGLLANLRGHKVTESDDGTITVSPSILCDDGVNQWHGFLEFGNWREC